MPAAEVVVDLRLALGDDVAGPVTGRALTWLGELSDTHESLIPMMAGRAEEPVGNPEDVSQRTWALIQEVLDMRHGFEPAPIASRRSRHAILVSS